MPESQNPLPRDPKRFAVITLFPEMFEKVLGQSMMWKATEIAAAEFHIIDLREFGLGPRKQVDDTVYGGGDGMLLKIEPLYAAVEHAKTLVGKDSKVILTSPRGKTWTQAMAREFASEASNSVSAVIFICGHYEGFDERIMTLVDAQISIGDYILTGGELPAMVMIDSIVRLLPGVLGGEQSAAIESFSDGDNLEYPQYTRPETFITPDGTALKVPEILLSGHHAAIAKWRTENTTTRGTAIANDATATRGTTTRTAD
ncbi:tRNA (guanosine(37)-N1)-methyltransferase TrmD [Candidatus Saccharibacteria bacterium]|nr:tRNA (guanosine(37)-N1)-methyltransferase TrmD [Candidatus Saccharibacteria bacterium]